MGSLDVSFLKNVFAALRTYLKCLEKIHPRGLRGEEKTFMSSELHWKITSS